MIYEEFKNKFPIGSKIKVNYGFCGKIFGEINLYNDYKSSVLIYWCSTNLFGYSDCTYWHNTSENIISNLELAPEIETKSSVQENKLCPRCSKEMGKIQTDQYGLIDKCQSCGYC